MAGRQAGRTAKQFQFRSDKPKVLGDCLTAAMRKIAPEVEPRGRRIDDRRGALPGFGLLFHHARLACTTGRRA